MYNNYKFYIIISLFEIVITMIISLGTLVVASKRDALEEIDLDALSELSTKANDYVQQGKQLAKD